MANLALANPDVLRIVVRYVTDKTFVFFALVSKGWREVRGRRPTITGAIPTPETSVFSAALERLVRRTERQHRGVYSRSPTRKPGTPALRQGTWMPLGRRNFRRGCPAGPPKRRRVPRTQRLPLERERLLFRCGRRPSGPVEVAAREQVSLVQRHLLRRRLGGHLDVLRWVRANGCPWNEKTCATAAYRGHLDVLR